jgi:hypothetical protein
VSVLTNDCIAIFGSNSYSARLLVDNLKLKHAKLKLFTSSTPQLDEIEITRKYSFNSPFNINELQDVSKVIYFSWSTSRDKNAQLISMERANQISNFCKTLNIPAILISTLSSSKENPRSNYGKFKKMSEDAFLEDGNSVVRFGTIFERNVIGGSALSSIPRFGIFKNILGGILPGIVLPITSVDSFLSYFSTSEEFRGGKIEEIVDSKVNLWNMSPVNSEIKPLRIPVGLVKLMPINLADRLKTLMDINGI